MHNVNIYLLVSEKVKEKHLFLAMQLFIFDSHTQIYFSIIFPRDVCFNVITFHPRLAQFAHKLDVCLYS